MTNERGVEPTPIPGTDGALADQPLRRPGRHLPHMHVNIVTFEPGAAIPFTEAHVMEHGPYVLQARPSTGSTKTGWRSRRGLDVAPRVLPQACYAGGSGRFRYLLYKDVNRHMIFCRHS